MIKQCKKKKKKGKEYLFSVFLPTHDNIIPTATVKYKALISTMLPGKSSPQVPAFQKEL